MQQEEQSPVSLGVPRPLLYSGISNEIKGIAVAALQNNSQGDLSPPPPPPPTSFSPLSHPLLLVPRRPPSPFSGIPEEEEKGSDSGGSEDRLLPRSDRESCTLSRHRVPDAMPDIQLGGHTVRSHGAKVARFHMHDWIVLLLLMVIDIILNVIEPFHRFVGEDMLTDLRYPLKSNTVPFWAVPLIAILLPFVIFIAIYIKKRNVYDLHQAILGLLFSVLITAVLTDAIKDAVGRPRPDFFWRCFPDGKGVYDNVSTSVICNGEKSVIKEGHKSFPSGHSSWSFAGLGFLAWYLCGKLRAFDRRGHVAKLCIVVLPLLGAALVAVSRVDDYWHHWQDVFAGGLLGSTVASFCYLQFFPPPYDADGWWPHAHFQALADSHDSGQVSSTTNAHNSRPSEIEIVYDSYEGPGGVNMRDASPILGPMEAGRRH
ncbi:lipid phosphate phosphatase 2-like isoform X1 [Phoenix dactylifera]|uniref:Lipid phosphate phosphatase 2-like isoform X1 n=2 Tax=Phoenix dactylifera TaxID=42345 RepID=A0A8B7C6F2_PHODC|nr:lipid phosphate phosphatase 2-like isoform X1 [Phoenix dactylifera]